METRNILDKDGLVVGSMSLPDDTPEEVWVEKLSHYNGTAKIPNIKTLGNDVVLYAGNNAFLKAGEYLSWATGIPSHITPYYPDKDRTIKFVELTVAGNQAQEAKVALMFNGLQVLTLVMEAGKKKAQLNVLRVLDDKDGLSIKVIEGTIQQPQMRIEME